MNYNNKEYVLNCARMDAAYLLKISCEWSDCKECIFGDEFTDKDNVLCLLGVPKRWKIKQLPRGHVIDYK